MQSPRGAGRDRPARPTTTARTRTVTRTTTSCESSGGVREREEPANAHQRGPPVRPWLLVGVAATAAVSAGLWGLAAGVRTATGALDAGALATLGLDARLEAVVAVGESGARVGAVLAALGCWYVLLRAGAWAYLRWS